MRICRFRFFAAFAAAHVVLGCTSARSESTSPSTHASPRSDDAGREASASLDGASGGAVDASAAAEAAPEVHEPTFDEVAFALWADRPPPSAVAGCPSSLPSEARIRCIFEARYAGDPAAAHLANELFVRFKSVAGVVVPHTMDGGYRGMIRIEPALPLHADRKHLAWIVDALRDFDAFFGELERHRDTREKDGGGTGKAARYRFAPITLEFMRSVGARTPSAYAIDWTVSWNLNGSLNTAADAARETMFHEVFHLNDAAHGPGGPGASSSRDDGWWSIGALGSIFDGVVRRCGTKIPCLTPYSPNDTTVRGGTYYSFQPGNGVREYAAELALRYYREQREVLRSLPKSKPKPFKCGPSENAQAWDLMKNEFFGGIDVVPPC